MDELTGYGEFKDLLDDCDKEDLQKQEDASVAKDIQVKDFSSEVCRLRSEARKQKDKKAKGAKPAAHPIAKMRYPTSVPNRGSTTRDEAQCCAPPGNNNIVCTNAGLSNSCITNYVHVVVSCSCGTQPVLLALAATWLENKFGMGQADWGKPSVTRYSAHAHLSTRSKDPS